MDTPSYLDSLIKKKLGPTDFHNIQKIQQIFTCSNSTIETLEKDLKFLKSQQWRRSGVFIVNFEYILYIFLVFPLLYLNRKMFNSESLITFLATF